MCVNSRMILLWAALLPAAGPWVAAAPGQKAAADPLLPYLEEEDSQSRARLLALLKEQGRPPCPILGGYARSLKSRVREQAVRAMDDAACSDFESYSGFLLDSAAGVMDALLDAAWRRQMIDAVPFLLGSLSDRRRIVTE